MFLRRALPGSESRLTIVDHEEAYGRHVLARCVESMQVNRCIDIGCGGGTDLGIVLKHHPNADVTGIDFGTWCSERLSKAGIRLVTMNVEKESLPFDDGSVDLVIANQFFEHVKELCWINHEIFRVLRVGGYLFFGTPNLLSLHNRVMMLVGRHPTQHKLESAHVRVFSRSDVFRFYRHVAPRVCHIEGFYGSQFYPFPKAIARPLASLLPSYAFSIFFLIKKVDEYKNEFIEWPTKGRLESNFYTGETVAH